MMRATILLVLASCASATTTVPDVRFANAPPARVVNDRRNVPKPPEEVPFVRWLYHFDGQFHRRITRGLELPRPQRAQGINALDEVPDSTWFTNRIGVRPVSPEEIAAAPGGVGSPEPYTPWTIISTKVGGVTVGFIIKDSRGKKFLLKFDPRGLPEAETANQVIVGKLFWAFGLNVTEDYVVHVNKRDLVLAPDAVIKDQLGGERPLTQRELEARLATIDTESDGTLRALASAWLEGKPLGGHAPEGVRPDDPNDRIPHELRRDLRGLYALFAWLDHTDVHGANMLDMWVQDPADPKTHYVKHYWVDYGTALGFAAEKNHEPRVGYEWYLDEGEILNSLLSFGAYVRPWEDRADNPLRGVGLYEIDLYDPGTWKASSPAYLPIYVSDRIDNFWASKIIMKFTRDHIRAAVDAGRLSDPRSAEWLTNAIIARQRKTARYWFERVNPLDEFTIDGDTLCFKDLSIAYAFATAPSTSYRLERFDRAGKSLGPPGRFAANAGGVTCTQVSLASTGDGYTIFRYTTERPGFTGSTQVHVARDPATGTPRVIGIYRQ